MVFYWSKLNWVSGASGIQYGGCLVRSAYLAGAVDVGGSVIHTNVAHTNVAPNYDTNVFVPDLGEGNKVYFESVDGGGPRVESGQKEPFHFHVRYAEQDGRVGIGASMSGDRPVFFVVLPPDVTSEQDVKRAVSSEYVDDLLPLIDLNNDVLENYVSDDEYRLTYFNENRLSERSSIRIEGRERRASFDFSLSGALRDIVPKLTTCIGQNATISTCFQGLAQ